MALKACFGSLSSLKIQLQPSCSFVKEEAVFSFHEVPMRLPGSLKGKTGPHLTLGIRFFSFKPAGGVSGLFFLFFF